MMSYNDIIQMITFYDITVVFNTMILSFIFSRKISFICSIVSGFKEKINWIKRNDWHENKNDAERIIETWKNSWESLDPHDFISQHSINFKGKKHDFESRVAHILRIIKDKTFIKLKVDNLNLFYYPENKNLIYSYFTQHYESNNFNTTSSKELFWKKEKDGVWRILYEDT